jgi:penicillin-binding protein-related factor A (putative recombinase)
MLINKNNPSEKLSLDICAMSVITLQIDLVLMDKVRKKKIICFILSVFTSLNITYHGQINHMLFHW